MIKWNSDQVLVFDAGYRALVLLIISVFSFLCFCLALVDLDIKPPSFHPQVITLFISLSVFVLFVSYA